MPIATSIFGEMSTTLKDQLWEGFISRGYDRSNTGNLPGFRNNF